MLEPFGVTADAESVYRAVLAGPGRGTADLATELGVEKAHVAEHLQHLTDLGLVVDAGGTRAVPPDRALDLLIAREEAAIEERRAVLQASREAIPELVGEYVERRRSYVGDRLELLTDSALVRARLYQLTSSATTRAWALSPGAALSPAAVEAALPLDRELAARGVDARMVVGVDSLGPGHWNAYLSALIEIGHQVRVSTTVQQRAIVVDDEWAVVPSTDGGVGMKGAYVMHGKSLVAPVTGLFEEIWAAAEPFTTPVEDAEVGGPISENRMRQVAVLLARGLKDDALARRLGVSVRTVRRLTAATMDELGAESRFEAGVRAVARGWVEVGALSGGMPDR